MLENNRGLQNELTPNDEEIYQKFFDLFSHPAWSLLMSLCSDQEELMKEAMVQERDWGAVNEFRGRLIQLKAFMDLEDIMLTEYQAKKESVSEAGI